MAKSKNKSLAIGDKVATATLKNLPFVFFLGALLLLYLATISYAQKQIVRIQSLKKEVESLRREYHALEAEISYKSIYSQVKKEVAAQKLRSSARRLVRVDAKNQ